MEINVTKNDVLISCDQLHKGEFNINPLHFNFSEEYTDDLVKKVVFTNLEGQSYAETIINDVATIPYEILVERGDVLLGVYAYQVDGDNLLLRYSPKPIYVTVQQGSWVDAQDGTVLVPALTIEQYEQALNEIIEKWTIDSQAIIDHIVTTSEAEFGEYYNGKLGDFNDNATDKTNTYNNNATTKLGDYNTNATNKTNTFNQNATDKTNAYNNNATDKLGAYNDNATQKLGAYNDNATEKLGEYNTNATNKTTAYDNNAQAKVDYYDQHASEIIEMNELLLDQIPTSTATGETINVNDSSNLPLKNFEMMGNATQDGTPTPSTPQAIHVVTGDNTVKVTGKNLLKPYFQTSTQGGITVTSTDKGFLVNGTNTSSSQSFKIFEKNLPAGTYTINGIAGGSATTFGLVLKINNGASNYVRASKFTFTLEEQSSINVTLYTYQAYGVYNNLLLPYQIELGSTATTYEPYQEQTVTLPLGDIELAKMSSATVTYSDKIYKENNKWYLLKNMFKYTMTGNETISLYSETNMNFRFRIASNVRTAGAAISNYFNRGTYQGGSTQYPSVGISDGNWLYIRYNSTAIATQYGITDVASLKTWITTNKPIIYYILNAPTITEITDTALITALEQVLSMTTYKTTTNAFTLTVSDNATPTLQVEYRQDIGTLISNLNNAILSLGNNV